LFTLGSALAVVSPSGQGRGELKVEVSGCANDQGRILFYLCNSEESYSSKSKSITQASVAVKNKRAETVFRDLPYGSYAVKVYHDENGNGQLDKGWMGIPTERYGFSNNARGSFGPPSFKEAQFTLSSPNQTIRIEVK